MENINQPLRLARMVALVLLVVMVGCALFDWGLSYYYRAELSGGSCELCYKLNPAYEVCREVKAPGESGALDFTDFNFTFENGRQN